MLRSGRSFRRRINSDEVDSWFGGQGKLLEDGQRFGAEVACLTSDFHDRVRHSLEDVSVYDVPALLLENSHGRQPASDAADVRTVSVRPQPAFCEVLGEFFLAEFASGFH